MKRNKRKNITIKLLFSGYLENNTVVFDGNIKKYIEMYDEDGSYLMIAPIDNLGIKFENITFCNYKNSNEVSSIGD